MLRFFRNIRHSLVTESRFSKYLLYAIGEIILVMIGILLALQVNNWNQQQEQQRAVKRYLASLVEDLNHDLEQFQELSDHAVFRFHSSQLLLKMVGEAPVKLRPGESVKALTAQNIIWDQPLPNEPDSLFVALTFLWSVRGAPPVISRPTIGEMTASGLFSAIDNKSLKDAINAYYIDLDWRFSDEQIFERSEIIRNWKESLAESGVLAQDVSNVEDPLGLIRNNKERIGLLRNVIRAAWFEAASLEVLPGQALHLIQLIERELDK